MGIFDRLRRTPKRDEFAELYMAAMREAGDTRQFEYDAENFRIVYTQGSGYTHLGNFYDEFCAVPAKQRQECIRRMVRGSLAHLREMPEEFEDAKHDLRPKVWTRSTFENVTLRQRLEGGKAPDIPMQQIGEHLVATLVYDFPEAVRTICREDLDDWGISFYEAMEVARQNLQEADFAFASIGDHMFGSATGDNYDASRLLIVDLVRKLEVAGDHIAMVPNRDSLLITGSDDEEGLEMMHTVAGKFLKEDPRPMIGSALRLNGDDWVDWMPSAQHPLYRAFREMELKWMHQEYETQKQMLDAIHEKEGIEIFVANYMAVQKDTGELVSYCAWTKGVDSILPKAHKVVFVRGEDIVATASWDKVQAIVGSMMEPVDVYPPRVRVTEFPTDEQLAEIGKEGL